MQLHYIICQCYTCNLQDYSDTIYPISTYTCKSSLCEVAVLSLHCVQCLVYISKSYLEQKPSFLLSMGQDKILPFDRTDYRHLWISLKLPCHIVKTCLINNKRAIGTNINVSVGVIYTCMNILYHIAIQDARYFICIS